MTRNLSGTSRKTPVKLFCAECGEIGMEIDWVGGMYVGDDGPIEDCPSHRPRG